MTTRRPTDGSVLSHWFWHHIKQMTIIETATFFFSFDVQRRDICWIFKRERQILSTIITKISKHAGESVVVRWANANQRGEGMTVGAFITWIFPSTSSLLLCFPVLIISFFFWWCFSWFFGAWRWMWKKQKQTKKNNEKRKTKQENSFDIQIFFFFSFSKCI